MKHLFKLLFALLVIAGTPFAQAHLINWTVTGQFSDNTSITGNFSIDNVLHKFVSFDVFTQAQDHFAGHHYVLNDAFLIRPSAIALQAPISPNDPFVDQLLVRFSEAMFTLGFNMTVIGLDVTETSTSPTTRSSALMRVSQSIVFTSEPNPNEVPEPLTIALFVLGLGVLLRLKAAGGKSAFR